MMSCPKCSNRSSTDDTWSFSQYVVREHTCKECSHHFASIQVAFNEDGSRPVGTFSVLGSSFVGAVTADTVVGPSDDPDYPDQEVIAEVPRPAPFKDEEFNKLGAKVDEIFGKFGIK
jgi:hypothetical protein